jgi:hypothetical protein
MAIPADLSAHGSPWTYNRLAMRNTRLARAEKRISFLLVAALLADSTPAAVRGDRAAYMGGTATIPRETQGTFDIGDTRELHFRYSAGVYSIPYASITSMEFGEKVGRRVGVAIAVTWIALFSKKKRHYLTLGYTGPTGSAEAAVFELSKGIYQTVVPTIEARTGKRVEIISDGKNTPEVQHSIATNQTPAATAAPSQQPPTPADQAVAPSATQPIIVPVTVPAVPNSGLVPITFASNPPGAVVSFSRMGVCYTPCVTKLEPNRRYAVKMILGGYADWTSEITVEAGKPATVVAELQKQQQ